MIWVWRIHFSHIILCYFQLKKYIGIHIYQSYWVLYKKYLFLLILLILWIKYSKCIWKCWPYKCMIHHHFFLLSVFYFERWFSGKILMETLPTHCSGKRSSKMMFWKVIKNFELVILSLPWQFFHFQAPSRIAFNFTSVYWFFPSLHSSLIMRCEFYTYFSYLINFVGIMWTNVDTVKIILLFCRKSSYTMLFRFLPSFKHTFHKCDLQNPLFFRL